MFKLVFKKAEEPEIKLPTSAGSSKKQENFRKKKKKHINFCFIDYAKAFDGVDHNKLWKILKEMGIPVAPRTHTFLRSSTSSLFTLPYHSHTAVMYGCESWAIKKAEHQRTEIFELWC